MFFKSSEAFPRFQIVSKQEDTVYAIYFIESSSMLVDYSLYW